MCFFYNLILIVCLITACGGSTSTPPPITTSPAGPTYQGLEVEEEISMTEFPVISNFKATEIGLISTFNVEWDSFSFGHFLSMSADGNYLIAGSTSTFVKAYQYNQDQERYEAAKTLLGK